jgi:hypothetical protein
MGKPETGMQGTGGKSHYSGCDARGVRRSGRGGGTRHFSFHNESGGLNPVYLHPAVFKHRKRPAARRGPRSRRRAVQKRGGKESRKCLYPPETSVRRLTR